MAISLTHHLLSQTKAFKELYEYAQSQMPPQTYPTNSFLWFSIALTAIQQQSPFLMNFSKTFRAFKNDVLVPTKTLIPLLAAESDRYRTLSGVTQQHLNTFSTCKPTTQELLDAISTTWQTYVDITNKSHREEYQKQHASLTKRIVEAKRVKISETGKEFLKRRHYINPGIIDGCLEGYNCQTYEAEKLLGAIERLWQERNEACKAFEAGWDRLNYTLHNRRVVPSDRVFHLWHNIMGGYLIKESERDRRETEPTSPSCNTKEEPLPEEPLEICWLDLAADIWRLYAVNCCLLELRSAEQTEENKTLTEKCLASEMLVMAPEEALTTDKELLTSAFILRGNITISLGNFTLLCSSMQETEASICNAHGDEETLDKIKTQTLPSHHASYHEHHKTALTMTPKVLEVIERLETFTRIYTPPSEVAQLGISLEVLGFTTAKELLQEYASVTTLYEKAQDWIVSLSEGNRELEAKKHEARIWYDWLHATVNNDFSPPWRLTFYGNRLIRGMTAIDK